jgi:hypothetical protein
MSFWVSNPCGEQAGWTAETVCIRPYDQGSYGRGPYGRCQIIGGSNWGQPPVTSFAAPAPAPPSTPFRRAARADVHH